MTRKLTETTARMIPEPGEDVEEGFGELLAARRRPRVAGAGAQGRRSSGVDGGVVGAHSGSMVGDVGAGRGGGHPNPAGREARLLLESAELFD